MKRSTKFLLAIPSAVLGVGIMVASFKFDSLNWIVDSPGWLVARFMSTDLHEGDGAPGFALALLLSWLCNSIVCWVLLWGSMRILKRGH